MSSALLRTAVVAALACVLAVRAAEAQKTFANPLDLDYRFMPTPPGWRQAADPLIVLSGDEYFLFASRSGGYWHSRDMRTWKLVVPDGLPIEDYAPAVVIVNGRMFYTAHKTKAIYTTDVPTAGRWRKVADIGEYADPAFFLDDDGRLYLYHGSALNGGIAVVELDPKHDFTVLAPSVKLFDANYLDHGWERSGADNLGAAMTEGFRIGPYVEGSWMTKRNGVYYLQYAAPGTVWNTYADGVYTSRSPTSGFTYAPYSPFSYRLAGFIGGAGHAGTFQDKSGNWWRVVTMIVSVRHKFERRIGIFPAGFDSDGVIRTDTYLGDYPQFLPGGVPRPIDHNLAGWMLLSKKARATASSSLDGHGPALADDENIMTWWSARTGDSSEWLALDLGRTETIRAVQANLAEQAATALSRVPGEETRFVVEASRDRVSWQTLIDRRSATTDRTHVYAELEHAVRARYVRITNVHASGGGKFAVSDLRVFGTSTLPPPPRVRTFTVKRHAPDDRGVTITWQRVPRADTYVVRYGISPDKLYASVQVGNMSTLTLNSLNRGVTYWFVVDAVGPGGIMRGGNALH